MSGETKQFALSVKQGDKASRGVEVSLFDEGEPYKIPTDAKAYVNVRKPDRKHVFRPCTFSGNTITIELTNNMLAAAGTALVEVEIKTADESQNITSVVFEMEIEQRVGTGDAIESSNEFTDFEKKMNLYADAEKARASAESSRASAETLRSTAEKNRAAAEMARTSAETARAQAETTRAAEEKKRASTETVRAQAETGRENAESSRASAESSRASAETSRSTAEKNRAAAEMARTSAETARAQAETTRAAEEKSRVSAETAREQAEKSRQESAEKALEKANKAVEIANQVNEAHYITNKDSGQKYAYAIYTENGVPHLVLTPITG